MPKDKYAGSDPDPTQFLFVSPEQKRADQVGLFLKVATTLVDLLFIQLMSHPSHAKQMCSQPMHLTHELIL